MWVFKKVHSNRIFNLSLILILILKSFVNFNDFNEYCVSYMSIHCSHLCLCWKKTSVPINQCANNKVICPIRWKTCFTYYWNFLACFMKFIFQSIYYTTQWKRVIHSVQDSDWLVDVHSLHICLTLYLENLFIYHKPKPPLFIFYSYINPAFFLHF